MLSLVYFLIVLGVLVIVHEFGHFIVAKKIGVRVEKFSIGFGPKICSVKKGDTEYLVSAIPLGGYVKMFGDDPMADIPADQKAFSLTAKPVGQRIAVVVDEPLLGQRCEIDRCSHVRLSVSELKKPARGGLSVLLGWVKCWREHHQNGESF